MNYIEQAKYLVHDESVNVVPISSETKKPTIRWKYLQNQVITDEEIEEHFYDCGGVAVLTGQDNSPMVCIDMDLKNAPTNTDYFNAFMECMPYDIKSKFLVNQTRSVVGRHLWMKTKIKDKSRKIVNRTLTIPELFDKYEVMMTTVPDMTEQKASKILMKKPMSCVIETRHTGSYALICGDGYERIWNDKFEWFTDDEVEFIFDTLYSFDEGYSPPSTYKGSISNYRFIRKFNEDHNASDVLSFLLNSGVFTEVEMDYTGNLRALRNGSSAGHSLVIFKDTALTHVFSHNTIFSESGTYSPFEVFCICNGVSEDGGLKLLNK